jgi:hypothetical protein
MKRLDEVQGSSRLDVDEGMLVRARPEKSSRSACRRLLLFG